MQKATEKLESLKKLGKIKGKGGKTPPKKGKKKVRGGDVQRRES